MIKTFISQIFSKKSKHPNLNLSNSVYFGNLPFDANEEMIRSALSDFSRPSNVIVARNSKGLFMGYAFAELSSPAEVASAVSKLHESTLGIKALRKIHVEPGSSYPELIARIGQ